MKSAVETMTGMIVITFMAVLSTAYLLSSLNTQKAQNYHSTIIAEVESGDFSPIVIESCKVMALENGYTELIIDTLESVKSEKYAKVTLVYEYIIPILNLNMKHQITGYAR